MSIVAGDDDAPIRPEARTDWIPIDALTSTALLVVLAIALFGLLLAIRCLRCIGRRRPLAATGCALGAGSCLALAGIGGLLMLSLHGYQRLIEERAVATIVFEAQAEDRYRARLVTAATGETRALDLEGDEWQIDARVVTWHPVTRLLGLDARYRLERLSGRYRDIDEHNRRRPPTLDLADRRSPIDAARVARWLPEWARIVDADYGSAVYLPMADGLAYRISLTPTGLIARPDNAAAREAIARW